MISKGSGGACKVRVAVLAGKYDLEADFSDLHIDGIEVREYSWRSISNAEAAAIKRNQQELTSLDFEAYQLPDDGVDNCLDSDLWFIVSDRLEQPLAPVKPYVVFATDYIQRYFPWIFPKSQWGEIDNGYLVAARRALAVIATTPQTAQDVISYAGVPASRVHLAPMDFDPTTLLDADAGTAEKSEAPYIIWPTNPAQHKNHERAFEALIKYFEELHGTLDVKVIGPNSRWLDPSFKVPPQVEAISYVNVVRRKVADHPILTERVSFAGELSDDRYSAALRGATFLWHPTVIDNGTFVVAEAAWCDCPSLASGYPQMRFIGERFSIPMEFFKASSVDEMAKALKEMESKASFVRSILPSRTSLSRHSWQSYASEYWDMLQGIAAS
jgi:glycosyltransferase involved in cell wall biosynthesis